MQIRVRYENGVFVPLEHIEPVFYEDATVTVKVIETEKKPVTREKSVTTDEHRARAKAYIEKNFPDVEVSQEVMNLIGILRGVQCDDYKAEYRKHLEEKYADYNAFREA